MRDRTILYAGAFIRASGTGMAGVLAGVYLARLALTPFEVGLVLTVGMTGAALATLLVTLVADRIGRRPMLIGLSLMSCGGGILLAVTSEWTVLLLSAFAGMLNGMGRDRGASVVLDQAVLPATVPVNDRTTAFARYTLLQDIGHATGALLGGLPALLVRSGYEGLAATRLSLTVYALLMLLPAVLYTGLTAATEPLSTRRANLSPESQRRLWKLSSLFALDAIGGGFLTAALISYFFFERFGVAEGAVAVLFFAARIANMLSYPAAAWLARRFGLLNTMVFTHVPSSVFLMMVALAPSFPVAAALFLAREALVEMDVPTRQSYVVAIVHPEERTIVSGVTQLVRLGGWVTGPTLAGALMQGLSLAAPLFTGAALKIVYDIALYRSFKTIRPPEEIRPAE
jgi:MFS family permease